MNELLDIRSSLEYLIAVAIDEQVKLSGRAAQSYIETFAKHIVQAMARRSEIAISTGDARKARTYDPVAIISLNWDMIFDRCIHEQLVLRDNFASRDYEPIGVVDYCCYVSPLEETDNRIQSGLWALGARGYNVKLLKLHGSMNWLQCPNCQRIFVKYDEGKISIPEDLVHRKCRLCAKHDVAADLRGSLVMPTFLKDLSSFQIKVIWQNAAVELLEARKLVFIGYSLPQADFEFRQLLGRMVHRDAEILVVSHSKGDPDPNYDAECLRYKQFFGGRSVQFDSGGVISFIDRLNAG